jgi:glycerophosphoryl diester phosphodiesterase
MGAFRMEILNLILAVVIALLGLPIGFILAKIAKEELKAGEYYFHWLQIILLIIAVNAFFYSFRLKLSTSLLILAITSILIIKYKPRAVIGYIIFALLFSLTIKDININIIISSLAFLFGLPTAALVAVEGLEEIKKPLGYKKRKVLIIGHRGALDYEIGNTIKSYKKAIEMKVDMIEADARMTKDKKIVMMHDTSVRRTTNGRGRVKNLTLKEIKKLKTKNNDKIPTLQEAIDTIKGKCELNIHIKEDNAVDKIVEIIKNKNFKDKVILSSFSEKALARIKELDKSIRIAYIFRKPTMRYIRIATRMDAYALHPVYPLLTPTVVIRAHLHGLKVNTWTIKSRRSVLMSKYFYRVDGIMSNDPFLYKKKK